MSEFFSSRFASQALASKLASLRTHGRASLLAALGAPESADSPALPTLQGEDLAKHHLALALEACHGPGTSKPHAFARLRLLVNKLEQGHVLPPTRVTVPKAPEVSHSPTSGRRSRLISRAIQSANQIAEWRKSAIDSRTDLR